MSSFCTFPATGTQPTFQAIYICVTCSQKNFCSDNNNGEDGEAMPLCICHNCAEACHSSHEVEYYGEGPCYCDCVSFYNDGGVEGCSCLLQEASIEAAMKLGIYQELNVKIGHHENECTEESVILNALLEKKKMSGDRDGDGDGDGNRNGNEDGFPFFFDVLTIPSLLPNKVNAPCESLMQQAMELVKHSTDTHWIPHNEKDVESLCQLEKLAYSIFQRHLDQYGLRDCLRPDGGLEWWVQVKNDNASNAAIDLHYDKDEELAEMFDLGSFPTLSTVTYLSGNMISDGVGTAPTIIFPHTYEMPGEGVIGGDDIFDDSSNQTSRSSPSAPGFLISHVRTGKHLVFDGKLLHGSPSNSQLRQNPELFENDKYGKGIRVTFLVNIWLKRRPSKVTMLNTDIRDKLNTSEGIDQQIHYRRGDSGNPVTEMIHRNVGHFDLKDVADISDVRINLPFVSTGATWIDDCADDESESGLIVSIIPPRNYEDDTVVITYNEEMAPTLEYQGMESDEEGSEGD